MLQSCLIGESFSTWCSNLTSELWNPGSSYSHFVRCFIKDCLSSFQVNYSTARTSFIKHLKKHVFCTCEKLVKFLRGKLKENTMYLCSLHFSSSLSGNKTWSPSKHNPLKLYKPCKYRDNNICEISSFYNGFCHDKIPSVSA